MIVGLARSRCSSVIETLTLACMKVRRENRYIVLVCDQCPKPFALAFATSFQYFSALAFLNLGPTLTMTNSEAFQKNPMTATMMNVFR